MSPPRELHRRLDCLGAGIAEEYSRQVADAAREVLGEEPREKGDIELHQVRQLGVEHVLERPADRRMIAAEGEDSEPAQKIEIAMAVAVEEISAFGARKVGIETDRLQDARQLRVQVAIEEEALFPCPFRDELPQIEGHATPCEGKGLILGRQPFRTTSPKGVDSA